MGGRKWGGIIAAMRWIFGLAALLLVTFATASAAEPPLTDGVSGAPVTWGEWLPRRAPVALLVWASWAPGADQALAAYETVERASAAAGFELVLLDVQEPLADGRAALGGRDVAWIHDRHGALLKLYRVIEVPSLVLLDGDGEVVGRIDATAEAMRDWASR